MSFSSLLEKIASTREGSSCGANACLIRRLQAGVSKLRKGKRIWNDHHPNRRGGTGNVPLSATGTAAVLPDEMGAAELALSSLLGLGRRVAIIAGLVRGMLVRDGGRV